MAGGKGFGDGLLCADVKERCELPNLDHLTKEVLETVYEPSEDTYLLLDALQSEIPHILAIKPAFIVEVGPGSGVVTACLARELRKAGYRGAVHLCVDVNPTACETTLKTVISAMDGIGGGPVVVETVCGDLLQPFLARLKGLIDVFIMNPPYVPTTSDEVAKGGIAAAWAGGEDGREVVDRIFPQLGHLLSPTGLAYFVVERANRPSDFQSKLSAVGLSIATPIAARRAHNERLNIVRFERERKVEEGGGGEEEVGSGEC